MKSTWVSTSQRIGRPSANALEPRVRPEPAADLGGNPSVGHDHVGREVVLATNERRTDAVRVYRHAALLERTDALRGEATRGNDPHLLEAVMVERLTHLANEPLVDAARVEVPHLVPERAVDELARGVEPHAPEPRPESSRDLE